MTIERCAIPTNPRFIDLTGRRFGRWQVLYYAGQTKHKNKRWYCECECGGQKIVLGGNLTGGYSTQCWECNPGNLKHGCSGKPEWNTWRSRKRCYPVWPDAWRQFEAFIRDMGPRPEGCVFVCVNPSQMGEPTSYGWGTRSESTKNRRGLILYNGQTQSKLEWAKEIGITRQALHLRLASGMSVEQALTRRSAYNGKRMLEYGGITKRLFEWARDKGMRPDALYQRLKHGWSLKRALETPIQKRARTRRDKT